MFKSIFNHNPAAMPSYVLKEQNELVVTGMELRLRRLTADMFNDSLIYVIGSTHSIEYWMKTLEPAKTGSYFYMENTILDIAKVNRSKGIIICYNEPSYGGKQSLYHLFGEKLNLSYREFVDVMKKVQNDGDAIVFTGDDIMWFPGPKTEEPKTLQEPDLKSQLTEAIRLLTQVVSKLS